jgi:membrane protease YdiL (CAAX protease family)
MDNNKEIIEFEDLFKEEIEKRQEPPKPEDKKNYMKAILSYVLIMFFLNAVLVSVIQLIPGSIKVYEKDEVILEEIASDPSGIALMDKDIFDLYKEDYKGYVESLWTYNDYSIIYNTANPHIESLLIVKDDAGNIISFDEQTFLLIYDISDQKIDFWDQDQTYEITRYQHDEQTLPTYILTDDITIIDYQLQNLTSFYMSVYQFVLYLILFGFVYYFLKNDVAYDFNKFKLIKNQWFTIIVIGYLYVLLGNFLSNFISNLLSGQLNIPMSESVNQMTIVRMLNSNGVIFMVLSAVIIGPIVEELIFRKSIFGLIKNQNVALVLSSVIFGAIHLISEASLAEALINGISYFTMGVIFGYIYLKNDKNIIASIAVHILVNLISVVGSIFLF